VCSSDLPDPFNPRPARDPLGRPYGVFFDQWSVGWLYRQILLPLGGVPAVPTPPTNPIAGLLAYQIDAGEVAYQSTRALEYKWMEDQGKEAPGILANDKSTALYYWKQATKWGEPEAANAWLQRYYALKGTRKGAMGSIERSAPLAAIPEKDQRRFLQTLTPAERERLTRAQAWYKSTMRATGQSSLRRVRPSRPTAAPAAPTLGARLRDLSPISRGLSMSDSLMREANRK
jgi:hypothetical protein